MREGFLDALAFDYANALAARLGDGSLHTAEGGFANRVFIGERYIYKVKATDGVPPSEKERTVLEMLARRLPPRARAFVPAFIDCDVNEDGTYVQAHSRLEGFVATQLSDPTATALGEFLADLHSIDSFEALDEFDPRTERVSLEDYLTRYPSRFADKLRPGLAADDRGLVEAATTFISRRLPHLPPEPPLVLLHKDLHPANILLSNERLAGVVDWEACQTGPREWEFAILRQRFPRTWEVMAGAYGRPLDPDLLDVFGVLQSLRFWKSFPHHDAFAREQREHISWILSNHGET